MQSSYKISDKFIYRRHLLPTNTINKFLTSEEINLDSLVEFSLQKDVHEALFIASQELVSQIQKYKRGELNDSKKQEKLKESLLKYIIRISTRCTPFGLFAGCSLGTFADNTEVKMSNIDQFSRHTRLDMHYLINIADYLQKQKHIRYQLKFYPNSSLYKIVDKYRYVEYKYINGNRKHFIVEIEDNEYISAFINSAKNGVTINQLSAILIADEYSQDESNAYIEELIDNQILISELEPTVTGAEFIEHIIEKLKKLEGVDDIFNFLISIDSKIKSINKSSIGIDIDDYNSIITQIKSLEIPFNLKYILQTDLNLSNVNCSLQSSINNDMYEAFLVLNKLTAKNSETFLDKFKESFYSRYEEREMPLLNVLDTDLGIGFKQMGRSSSNDINPLVDDLFISGKQSSSYKTEVNSVQNLLHTKMLECIKTNSTEIEILDADLKNFPENTDDLPSSMSAMTEVFKTETGIEVFFKNVGGSSAANLLGRFAQSNSDIHNHVLDITSIEQKIDNEKILAEIVHVPESRIGNILQRPQIRDYEIPFLCRSSVNTNNTIYPDDLMISVKNGREIILRSKKLNKKIAPRLSTAHNFSNSGLPLYEFLCHLQTENIRGGVGFYWGDIENRFDFTPRVRYKSFIFDYAQWSVKKDELKDFDKEKDSLKLLSKINEWRLKRNMPSELLLIEGDNELYINLEHLDFVNLMLKTVSKRGGCKLKEFYFTKDKAIENNDGDVYRNQFIFTFTKQ